MTEEQKDIFLTKFSEAYNLTAAVKAAGIQTAQANDFLRRGGAAEVDRRVQRRLFGELLVRIRAEYEKIAFDCEEKVADRIRALDQLRAMSVSALSEEADGGLTVRVDYV